MRSLQVVAGLLLPVCALALLAARPVSQEGQVGDVRYSVLPPAQFSASAGPGWVLMDGRNVNGTNLCTGLGMCSVPDARGVFIRGMNMGRDAGTGDPEGNRPLGAYQASAVEQHSHPLAQRIVGDTRGGFQQGVAAGGGSGSIWDIGIKRTGDEGGKETRPRNVALYTYIKVD